MPTTSICRHILLEGSPPTPEFKKMGGTFALRQAKSVLAAKGEKKKAQQLASILREAKFMERYESEVQAREQRRQQLAKHW